MTRIAIYVPGRPVPQGSKTAFVNKKTGRAVVVDKDTRLPAWRMKITHAAIIARGGPLRPDLFPAVAVGSQTTEMQLADFVRS